jgi:hypothetical protein
VEEEEEKTKKEKEERMIKRYKIADLYRLNTCTIKKTIPP